MSRVWRRAALGLTAEPPPLAYFPAQPWYPWLIVGLVSIGAFIGQLDATIVQLALPTLGKTFDASLETVSWVSLAYLVAFASCLPIFGRLCEMFGRKTLYLIGYVLFVAASALCGFASDLHWLIVFRVFQGIGGSLLGANSISILVEGGRSGPARQGAGLLRGGASDRDERRPGGRRCAARHVGMAWVFWVSVPFGLVAAVIGWLVLPRTEDIEHDKTFDWWGACLLGPALIFLVLVLNQVSVWGATSPIIDHACSLFRRCCCGCWSGRSVRRRLRSSIFACSGAPHSRVAASRSCSDMRCSMQCSF